MGHTHVPVIVPMNDQLTYVNLGGWAVDELDEPALPASLTHLVLRLVDGEMCAELLRWSPEAARPVVVPS